MRRRITVQGRRLRRPPVIPRGDVPNPTRVTAPPPDWDVERRVDGPERFKAERVIELLESVVGDRTGIVTAMDDQFLFPVVGLTMEDVELVRKHTEGLGIPVVAVATDRSRSRLEQLMFELADHFPEESVGVGMDLEAGLVTATIVNGAVSLEELREISLISSQQVILEGAADGTMAHSIDPSSLVRVESGAFEPVDERNNPPVRSGRWVNSGQSGCTAGWLMRNSAGALRHTTAGHCVSGAGASVTTASEAFQGSVQLHYPDGWDFATFSLPSSHDGVPAVTINSSGGYRDVDGSTGQGTGLQYCFAGRGIWREDNDSERCGTLNRSYVYEGKQLYCIERRTHRGDSGGPVYALDTAGQNDAYAAGTMVISVQVDYISPIPDDWFACYNPISSVVSASGYDMVYTK